MCEGGTIYTMYRLLVNTTLFRCTPDSFVPSTIGAQPRHGTFWTATAAGDKTTVPRRQLKARGQGELGGGGVGGVPPAVVVNSSANSMGVRHAHRSGVLLQHPTQPQGFAFCMCVCWGGGGYKGSGCACSPLAPTAPAPSAGTTGGPQEEGGPSQPPPPF